MTDRHEKVDAILKAINDRLDPKLWEILAHAVHAKQREGVKAVLGFWDEVDRLFTMISELKERDA